jgi:hypothetical protein
MYCEGENVINYVIACKSMFVDHLVVEIASETWVCLVVNLKWINIRPCRELFFKLEPLHMWWMSLHRRHEFPAKEEWFGLCGVWTNSSIVNERGLVETNLLYAKAWSYSNLALSHWFGVLGWTDNQYEGFILFCFSFVSLQELHSLRAILHTWPRAELKK